MGTVILGTFVVAWYGAFVFRGAYKYLVVSK